MAALVQRQINSTGGKNSGTPSSSSSRSSRKRIFTDGTDVRSNSEERENPMAALSWYHPFLTRHAADCMLIDNAPEGSYLLRPSTNYDRDLSYVLSAKLSSSVQHVKVTYCKGKYLFGNSTFDSVDSFKKHFEKEKPIIGGDSGVTVVLRFPYKRAVDEGHFYTDVVHHAVTNMVVSSSESDSALSAEEMDSDPGRAVISKEGFLTKEGKIRKSWKIRWFVLRGNILCYFRTKQSRHPIDRIDVSQARSVENCEYKQKQNCFSLELPRRTYYLQASGAEDRQQWIDILRSQLRSRPRETLS